MQPSARTILSLFLSRSALFAIIPLCSPKCYSFMGMSSCMTQLSNMEENFPFTPEWFFVNVHRRASLIRLVKSHFFVIRAIEMLVDMYGPLKKAKDALDVDEFWKIFERVVQHMDTVRGIPVDLLCDEKVNPIDLLRSFRSHSDEVVQFVQKAYEDSAFSEDIRKEIDRNCRLLKEAAETLSNLPEFTDTSFFKLIEQNAYRDSKITDLSSLAKEMMPDAFN